MNNSNKPLWQQQGGTEKENNNTKYKIQTNPKQIKQNKTTTSNQRPIPTGFTVGPIALTHY